MKLTMEIIRAAAADAGDRSMRAAGRKTWNEDDWNAMCREFTRLTCCMQYSEATD